MLLLQPTLILIKEWESSLKRRSLYAAKTAEAMEKINPEKRLTPRDSDVARGSSLSYNSVKFISRINAARVFPNHPVKGTPCQLSLSSVSARNAQPHDLSCDQRGLGMLPQQARKWQLLAIRALLVMIIGTFRFLLFFRFRKACVILKMVMLNFF